MFESWLYKKQIGEELGRHPSTITRELVRNTELRGYRPQQAQRLAEERKLQHRHFQIAEVAWVKTLTYDNGKEFALHEDIAKELDAKGYFAHPYHSWKRGLNENTNGLIRQYIPKGTSMGNLLRMRLAVSCID